MVSCCTKSLLAQYLVMLSLNTIFCGCEFSIVCVPYCVGLNCFLYAFLLCFQILLFWLSPASCPVFDIPVKERAVEFQVPTFFMIVTKISVLFTVCHKYFSVETFCFKSIIYIPVNIVLYL